MVLVIPGTNVNDFAFEFVIVIEQRIVVATIIVFDVVDFRGGLVFFTGSRWLFLDGGLRPGTPIAFRPCCRGQRDFASHCGQVIGSR